MSTLNKLTIKYERLQEQQLKILKELRNCEHELKQYKKNQNEYKLAEVKEIKNNDKKRIKILLIEQKLKYLNLLQDSSYSTCKRDTIQALECELLLIK